MSPGILLQQEAAGDLSTFLATSSHDFLLPSKDLHNTALANAKRFLDPLATSVIDAQDRRLEESRKKRKRSRQDDGERERDALRLREVYLVGFTVDGVWGQARRILEANTEELQRALQTRLERRAQQSSKAASASRGTVPTVRFGADGFELDSDQEEGSINDDENSSQNGSSEEGDDSYADEMPLDADDLEDTDEEEELGTGDEDIEAQESDIQEDEGQEADGSKDTFVQDKHGLNDGFFDIDDFNRESEFLEQNGQGNESSDEDEIDYGADPLAVSRAETQDDRQPSKQQRNDMDESDDEEEPAFGNADLNAPWSDDDGDDDEDRDGAAFDIQPTNGEDDGGNANDIQYADFFDPPPRPQMKTVRMRALPKTQPEDSAAQPTETDIQRTIDAVRRDIFEDEFSEADDDSEAEVDDDLPGRRNLSTHEKRQLTLAKQIRELEAAAIGKRQWQMSGEASAHARPENALLEEDLDFERAGKPVPVITAEVSSSIEDMIKQRILNRQFDEVVKRQPGTDPGSSMGGGQPRRGIFELSDRKDDQGLADSYEQAYLAQTDPNAKDARSEALKAQHAEIERLWADVSGKLDALTSWRYKPKPAGVEVRVVTDAPKILMEDARPSGVEGVQGEQSALAPQEIFRVGAKDSAGGGGEGEKRVVTTKGGSVLAAAELTRDQKTRRRRREKERIKKRDASSLPQSSAASGGVIVSGKGDGDNDNDDAQKRHGAGGRRRGKDGDDDRADVLKQLKAGGVRVIGKAGELRDVTGDRVRSSAGAAGSKSGSGGTFKL